MDQTQRVPNWRIVTAGLLDFVTIYAGGGFLIALSYGSIGSGNQTVSFNLTGWPAAVNLALTFAYFLVLNRFAGGTIWKHVLRVPVGPLLFPGGR